MNQRLEAYRKVYQKFDKNNDNSVDLSEICESLGIDKKEAAASLKEHDKNSDGQISFEEFYLIIKAEQKKIAKAQKKNCDKWRKCFNQFDHSGDGTLCIDEFQQFWKEVDSNIITASVDLLFAAADLDGTGKIDYDEFAAVLNSLG